MSRLVRPNNGPAYFRAVTCGCNCDTPQLPPLTGGDATYPMRKLIAQLNNGFWPFTAYNYTRTTAGGGQPGPLVPEFIFQGGIWGRFGGGIVLAAESVTFATTIGPDDTNYTVKTDTTISSGIWGTGTQTTVTTKLPFLKLVNGVPTAPVASAVTTGSLPVLDEGTLSEMVSTVDVDPGHPFVVPTSISETNFLYTDFTATISATTAVLKWLVREANIIRVNAPFYGLDTTLTNTSSHAGKILQTITQTITLSAPVQLNTLGQAALDVVDLYDDGLLFNLFDQPQVNMNWRAVTGASSYKVKRATKIGGPYAVVGTPGTNSYSDTTVTQGTVYFYVVSAVVGGVESANSQGIQVATSIPANPIRYYPDVGLLAPGPGTASGAPQGLQGQAINPQFQYATPRLLIQPYGNGLVPDGYVFSTNIAEPVMSGHTTDNSFFLARRDPIHASYAKSLMFLQNMGATHVLSTWSNPTQGKFYSGTPLADVTALFPALTFPNIYDLPDGGWYTDQMAFNPSHVNGLGDLYYGS